MFIIENLKTIEHDFIPQYMIQTYAKSDVNNYVRICTFYLMNWII